jgi:hypothetical protein
MWPLEAVIMVTAEVLILAGDSLTTGAKQGIAEYEGG